MKEKNKLMQDINFCTGISKNKKGVTLVALVVTIVVLLILAGVSIAMLSGDNGLIKQAQNASEEWEIAQDKEQLELAKQAEIAKGGGYIDVDDYFQRLEDEGIVNDKDADIVDNGDGTYDVTTENGNTFEVTPVPDEENAEDIEIDYVGQGEIVGPRINKIEVTDKTETSISVEVTTRNAEGGNYTYSYKKATDSSYTQAQTTANNTYTFTNLEENTKYDIKVKLETSEGSIEKTITVQTEAEKPPEEETPVGTITFGTVTWSGGNASIQVNTTSGYGMEYQINGTTEGSWTSIANNGTIQNLTHGNTVNVRLVNGSKRGEVQSTTIKDETVPKVTVSQQGSATTNSIAVSVQATDNESGMSTSPTYTYFIKKTSEGSYTQKASNANNSYTFTELDQETSYDIKVEVQGDKAGNKGEGTLTGITTGKVTGGTVEGAITFGNPTWSAGQASITISTNTSYKIEYQLNGTTGSWTEISNNGTIQNLAHNTTIYARLTDGNNHGDYTSTNIQDTVNPTVEVTQQGSATTNSITVNVEATDNESGMNTSPTYTYFIKKTSESTYQQKASNANNSYTFTGLDQETSYDIKVEVQGDKAGNKGEGTLTGITTGKVTGGTVEGAITFGNPTWSDGQASITVSTNTSYKIEYQLNGIEGSWTEISNNGTIQNLAHNTTIYARLTDGNNHGDYTSTNIQDTVNPTVTIESLTAEGTTIQITAKGTDNETGINEYIYSIKESAQEDSSYVEKARNATGTATIERIEAGKTYTVKVEVTDKAGNIGSATKEIEIKKPAISSDEISNNPKEYYGGVVSNYEPKIDAEVNWKILYSDGKNIYLIADDYVNYKYLPEGSNGFILDKNSNYEADFLRVPSDYYHYYPITDERLKALNSEFFKNEKSHNVDFANINMLAYMMDINAWDNFVGTSAEYAIGGPTVELLINSYNKKYETNYEIISTYVGYDVAMDSVKFDVNDSLYFISSTKKANQMWLASPESFYMNDGQNNEFFHAQYLCGMSYQGAMGGINYKTSLAGFRPVVCLKSEVELEKQEDGIYHIVDTVKTGKIIFGEPTWEEDQASVTVSTNTNFQIEYQINKVDEGSWTTIANNGTITGLKDGDIVYARLTDGTNHGDYASLTLVQPGVPGKEYNTDTDIEIGGYPVTIPGGATISKIPGEYESVEDGVVIYITNGEEITDWSDTTAIQEKYDQFVWIPVDKESAIIEEGKEITGSTNSEKFTSLKNYVSTNNKYPMAVKKEDGTYSGILYNFTGTKTIKITPINYMSKSTYREPAVLNDSDDAPDEDYGITEASLQEEYKTMIERVAEKGGFWVGRYETTNMNSSNFTTNAVNVVRGTTNGINNVDWYKMYEGQKAYKNSEQNISLKNSATTSSMIWGSQWDQIMIWMRGVENTIDKTNGIYYVTNAVGMGNYGTGDSDKSTSGPVATGKREQYKVKNVYDLAGNVYEWTLEANNTYYRVSRGGDYYGTDSSGTRASTRNYNFPIYSFSYNGSRLTLY